MFCVLNLKAILVRDLGNVIHRIRDPETGFNDALTKKKHVPQKGPLYFPL